MIRFIFNMIEADKNNTIADRKNIEAFEKLAQADSKLKSKQLEASNAIEKLANRKNGLLNTSINDFITLYEQIIKIDFIESDGIKELLYGVLPVSDFVSMVPKVKIQGKGLTTTETAGAFFLKGGVSGVIAKEAEINMHIASVRNRQADIVQAQAEAVCSALEYMAMRANKISDLLAKLNVLLVKSIISTTSLIDRNGYNRILYTNSDKKQIMTCINLATTIKKIIDTPLLDKDGKVTQAAINIVENGNEALSKIINSGIELGVIK